MTLPEPPAGKGVVAVACRKAPSGVVSDCRSYASKSSGAPLSEALKDAAVARLEGTALEPSSKVDAVFLTGLLVDLPADPPPEAPGPPLRADWLRKPTDAQFGNVYPAGAAERGIGGTVVLSCRVNDNGVMSGCLPVSESPAGQGFATAAMKLAPYFQLKIDPSGAATGKGQAIIPIVFTPPRN